jgi:hypothetical protein
VEDVFSARPSAGFKNWMALEGQLLQARKIFKMSSIITYRENV